MTKITINESMLQRLVAESVKKLLKEINEIGDTDAGYNAIRGAEEKARRAHRHIQAMKFQEYGDKIDQDRFKAGEGDPNGSKVIKATNKQITYTTGNDTITITTGGGVYKGNTKIGYFGTEEIPTATAWMKTPSKPVARKIALWCSKFMEMVSYNDPIGMKNLKNQLSDWHVWANL